MLHGAGRPSRHVARASGQARKGEVRAFDRVVIETTGLADPAPVIQALMTMPVVRRFRLQQVITTIDALHGLSTLSRHIESAKQAAVADEIILTKLDLSKSNSTPLLERLKGLNPGSRIHQSSPGKFPHPNELAIADIYDPRTKSSKVLEWLNAEAYAQKSEAHHHSGHHHHDVNRHSSDIGSFSLQFDVPLQWEHVSSWLDALVVCHSDDLLRVKGILDIAGRKKPIVVQAVQRLFHPPFELPEWPSGDHSSRIVFITRGLSRDYVAEVFETIRQRNIPPDVKTSGANLSGA